MRNAYPNIVGNFLFLSGQTTVTRNQFGASPDVGIIRGRRDARIVNVLVEVSYGVGLRRRTHEKIVGYFTEFPEILEAILIDIKYPWEYQIVNGVRHYNRDNGKIVCFHYRRSDFINNIIVPSYAISFGSTPLSQGQIARDIDITGLRSMNDFHGYGIQGDPDCSQAEIDLYRISIPGSTLLNADPNDPFALHATGYILAYLPDEFDMHIDLYQLQQYVRLNGLDMMNPPGV